MQELVLAAHAARYLASNKRYLLSHSQMRFPKTWCKEGLSGSSEMTLIHPLPSSVGAGVLLQGPYLYLPGSLHSQKVEGSDDSPLFEALCSILGPPVQERDQQTGPGPVESTRHVRKG